MGAILSPSGRYRYLLWRELTKQRVSIRRTCLFIMLNPSTADAEYDDPTIRRCKSFALREHCDRLEVVNLFAYRATNPDALKVISREVAFGPKNLEYIQQATHTAEVIIAGWGALGARYGMDKYILKLIDRPVYCLGKTMHGMPRHPLYVSNDQPLELFKP